MMAQFYEYMNVVLDMIKATYFPYLNNPDVLNCFETLKRNKTAMSINCKMYAFISYPCQMLQMIFSI